MKRAGAAYRMSFVLLAILLAGAQAVQADDAFRKDNLTIATAAGTHKFSVELAETREQQSKGLMFRNSLGPQDGMLFTYDEPTLITMWMRNTYIPLDMVFINANGRIHRIEENTEPFSERIIESGERVSAVLELPAGTSARLRLRPGDVVHHRHFGTGQ